MKKILIILVLLFNFINFAFADKLIIPYDCYPKKIQIAYAKHGRKLDLNGNDRTKDSWGFLVNEGARYIIYTYNSVTTEDLDVIMEIAKEG